MDTTYQQLRQHYSLLSDLELVRAAREGDLNDIARIALEVELNTRAIDARSYVLPAAAWRPDLSMALVLLTALVPVLVHLVYLR